MWMLVIKSLYFFLPAFFANMAPELFKWFPLNRPIHKQLFGKNKTWIGIITASLTGGFIFGIQKLLFSVSFFRELSIIDYDGFSLWLGFLLGFGAIIGDLVKSYFKRKNKIKPGESWKPWDQIDFAIGGLVMGWFLYVPTISVAIIIVVASFFLHMTVCRIGYILGIKKNKF